MRDLFAIAKFLFFRAIDFLVIDSDILCFQALCLMSYIYVIIHL